MGRMSVISMQLSEYIITLLTCPTIAKDMRFKSDQKKTTSEKQLVILEEDIRH
jgi:hypothetical protein